MPLLIGLIVLTVARLLLAGFNELSEDEAYYHMWSERLDWSYYSKGPGIALLMKLSTSLFGHGEIGVRFFSPILALGSSLLVFRMGRSLFDVRTASWAVLLLNLTPIFNAGSVLMTIDPISIFFWIAAMYAFWKALHRAASFNVWWPVTGMLVGIGFLAKYTNALLLLSMILLLVVSRRWRGQLRRPGLYVMLGCFLVWTTPVIVWNAQNDWITVTHLKERGNLDESSSMGINPGEVVEYLVGHLGVYSPLIFAGMVWALVISTRRFFKDEHQAFLVAFSLPIIAMYFLLSFNEAGELNWTAPGFIPVGILLAFHWKELSKMRPRLKLWLQWTAVFMGMGMSLMAVNTDLVRRAGVLWSYGKDKTLSKKAAGEILKEPQYWLENAGDFSARLRSWKSTAGEMGNIIEAFTEANGEPVFLISNRYQTGAAVGHYLAKDLKIIRPTAEYPIVHSMESQVAENQFSFWPGYAQIEKREMREIPEIGDAYLEETSSFLGKNALFFTDEMTRLTPPPRIKETFEDWYPVAVFDVLRRGQFVRRIRVFSCVNYMGREV